MNKINYIPVSIELHQRSALLELEYASGKQYKLPCEFLRILSPSAEVQGHGSGQEVLQTGKKNVKISQIKPVGNYAIQLVFDDGHDTGLYSWRYLHELCENQESYWSNYLERLQQAGEGRDPEVQIVRIGN
jgi:DUF971 family protein